MQSVWSLWHHLFVLCDAFILARIELHLVLFVLNYLLLNYLSYLLSNVYFVK